MAIEKVDTVGALAGRLTDRLRRIMPPGPRRDRLTEDLADTFGTDGGPIDAGACRAIEDVAHRYSRHLELHLEPGGTGEGAKMPAGTGEAEEMPGGTGEGAKMPAGTGEAEERCRAAPARPRRCRAGRRRTRTRWQGWPEA